MSNFRPTYSWTITPDTLTTDGYQTVSIDDAPAGTGELYLPSVTNLEAGIGSRITIIDPNGYIASGGIKIYPSVSDTYFTINGASFFNHTVTNCPLVLTYEGGTEWLAVTRSGSGTSSSFTYKQTLFVDTNGDDLTAVVGDLSKPWGTVSGALNYITANSLEGHSVHVFCGYYLETEQVVLANFKYCSLYLEAGVNIVVNISAYGGYNPWIFSESGCYLSIAGEVPGSSIIGKYVSSTIVINSDNDIFYLGYIRSTLDIDNIIIESKKNNSNTIFGTITIGGSGNTGCTLNIKDSVIRNSSGLEGVAILVLGNIKLQECKINIKNSTLISYTNSTFMKGTITIKGNIGHNLSISNSIVVDNSGGQALIYLSDTTPYVFMDNVTFWAALGSASSTYYNNALTGTVAYIYIAGRCVSNADLPSCPLTCTLYNPLFGDLDCLLPFNIPVIQ